MSRFVYLGDSIVNADTISRAIVRDGKLKVFYKDGTHEVSSYWTDSDNIMGTSHIVQVIPCVEPIVAIYDCDNEVCEEDIYYLALCADGEIRPIALRSGVYELLDTDSFKGLMAKKSGWRTSEKSNWYEICDILGFKMGGNK